MGEGRGRRFLRRLRFNSCAAALPLVGKPWVKDSPTRGFNFQRKVNQNLCSTNSLHINFTRCHLEKEKQRKGDTEEKRQRERVWSHTLNIAKVWFFSSTFSSESGTSSTGLFLNCPSSIRTSSSPFPWQRLGFSIKLHLTAKKKKKKNWERGTRSKKRDG